MPYKNPEQKKKYQEAYSKKRYEENKEKLLQESRERYKKRRDEVLDKQKERLASPEGRAKRNAWQTEYRDKNREKVTLYKRSHHLRTKYGLSVEEYDKLLESQNQSCALCGRPFGELSPRIDHCHKTGKVRGLLHMQCNVLLGHAEEKLEILKAAVDYLEKHNESNK